MAQNISLMGATYSAVPAVNLPKSGGGTATFTDVTDTTATASDVASGKTFYSADGTKTQGTSSGGGMNVQFYDGYDYVRATSYQATDVQLTVEVTGTYAVSWTGWRSTSSGTSGSQLYVNGTSRGSAITTFTGTYGQRVHQTGVALNAGDVITIRARSRGTSYYMYVANLIIEQTA